MEENNVLDLKSFLSRELITQFKITNKLLKRIDANLEFIGGALATIADANVDEDEEID